MNQRVCKLKPNSARILITSGGSPGGLDLGRQLAASGHQIFALHSFKFPLCGWSSHIHKTFQVASPNHNLEQYGKDITAIILKHKIDLIFPCYEEAFYLAQIREQFTPHCHVFTAPLTQLNELHNKDRFIQKSRAHQCPVPQTWAVTPANLSQLLHQSEHLVFKPTYSRFGQHTLIGQRKERVQRALNNLDDTPWIAQEWLEGDEYSFYALCEQGQILGWTIYKKTYSFLNVAVAFAHVFHERIFEWAQTFIHKERYTGQIAFDFIVTKDGVAQAIECNPRLTSGIHNFSTRYHIAYHPDTRALSLALQGHAPHTPSMLKMLVVSKFIITHFYKRTFWSDLTRARDITFERRDPLPFFGQIMLFLYLLALSVIRLTPIVELTMEDSQWNGER